MLKQGDVHVVNAGEGWGVEATGNKHASGTHATKPPAIERGRKLAQRNESELVVGNQGGKIGERRSYCNDPFPPRGWTSGISRRAEGPESKEETK